MSTKPEHDMQDFSPTPEAEKKIRIPGQGDYDAEDHKRACQAFCPIDIGADHAVGWTSTGDLYWLHKCTGDSYRGDQPWRWSVGTVDVTSGTKHELRKRLPIYVGGSILCVACGDHGFINDGKWVQA